MDKLLDVAYMDFRVFLAVESYGWEVGSLWGVVVIVAEVRTMKN